MQGCVAVVLRERRMLLTPFADKGEVARMLHAYASHVARLAIYQYSHSVGRTVEEAFYDLAHELLEPDVFHKIAADAEAVVAMPDVAPLCEPKPSVLLPSRAPRPEVNLGMSRKEALELLRSMPFDRPLPAVERLRMLLLDPDPHRHAVGEQVLAVLSHGE